MSEKIKRFRDELKGLIARGDLLHMAIQYECYPEEFKEKLQEALNNDERAITEYIKKIPKFIDAYQSW